MGPKARPFENHRFRIQQDFYFVNPGVPRERRSELVSLEVVSVSGLLLLQARQTHEELVSPLSPG